MFEDLWPWLAALGGIGAIALTGGAAAPAVMGAAEGAGAAGTAAGLGAAEAGLGAAGAAGGATAAEAGAAGALGAGSAAEAATPLASSFAPAFGGAGSSFGGAGGAAAAANATPLTAQFYSGVSPAFGGEAAATQSPILMGSQMSYAPVGQAAAQGATQMPWTAEQLANSVIGSNGAMPYAQVMGASPEQMLTYSQLSPASKPLISAEQAFKLAGQMMRQQPQQQGGVGGGMDSGPQQKVRSQQEISKQYHPGYMTQDEILRRILMARHARAM